MADDTLRSRQDMRILLAISEGEIESIDEIYLNDVAISNFNCDFAKTTGKVGQESISGFDDLAGATTPTSGGLTIKKGGKPLGSTNELADNAANFPPAPAKFYNIEYETTFVRLLIQMDSLYLHKKDGSSKEAEMYFDIWVNYGGTITDLDATVKDGGSKLTVRRKGLSMGKYSTSIEIERPKQLTNTNGYWHILIERLSPDTLTDAINVGDIEYYASVSKVVMTEYSNADNTTYAGTALIAIRVEDASVVGNSFPTVSAKGKGLKLKVPIDTYYNSIERTYLTPTWNGKFNAARKYTNNLSWVVYNLISDALTMQIPNEIINNAQTYSDVVIGCGIPQEFIAKYAFDKFAKYCDEVIHIDYGTILQTKLISVSKSGNDVTLVTNYIGSLVVGDFIVVKGISSGYNTTDAVYGTQVTGITTNTVNSTVQYSIKYAQSGTGSSVLTNAVVNYYKKSNIVKRYSVNGQFVERKEAETFINDILSIGNCFLSEIDGLVTIQYDYPLTTEEIASTLIFTNQNVVEGTFEYSDSSLNETYTQINVTIQDITNNNDTKTVVVSSSDLISWCNLQSIKVKPYYYYNPTNVNGDLPVNYFVDQFEFSVFDAVMEGTTDSRVAYRKGRSILWDSLMNSQLVTFKTLIQGSSLYKGQVIRIVDDAIINTDTKLTGRVVSSVINGGQLTITFDREITLEAGTTYTLSYISGDSLPAITIADNIELNNSSTNSSTLTVNRVAGSDIATVTIPNHGLLNSDYISITPIDIQHTDFILQSINITIVNANTISFVTNGADARSIQCFISKLIIIKSIVPESVTIASNSSQRILSNYTFTSTKKPIEDSNFAFINSEPKLFKVLSTIKDEDYYVTSCIRYDLNKFKYIDDNTVVTSVNSTTPAEVRNSKITTVALPAIEKVTLKTKWITNTNTTYNSDKTASATHTVNLTITLFWSYIRIYGIGGRPFAYSEDYVVTAGEEFNSQWAVTFDVGYLLSNGVSGTVNTNTTTAVIDLVFTVADDEIPDAGTPLEFRYNITPKSGIPYTTITYSDILSAEYKIDPSKKQVNLINS